MATTGADGYVSISAWITVSNGEGTPLTVKKVTAASAKPHVEHGNRQEILNPKKEDMITQEVKSVLKDLVTNELVTVIKSCRTTNLQTLLRNTLSYSRSMVYNIADQVMLSLLRKDVI